MIQRASLGGQIPTILPYRHYASWHGLCPPWGPRSLAIYWSLASVFPNIYGCDLLTIRICWADSEGI